MSNDWSESWFNTALQDHSTLTAEAHRLRRQSWAFQLLSGAGLIALGAGLAAKWLSIPQDDATLLLVTGVLVFLVGQMQSSFLRLRLQLLHHLRSLQQTS